MVQSLGIRWCSIRNFFILFFAIGKLAAQEAMTADEYVNGLTKVLLEQGAPAADLFMRQYAEAGLDLTPLRKVILEANHGERQKVEVNIHPQNQEVIDFMQRQFERSKVDFVELVPVYDSTLPAPDKPFVEDAASYERWTKCRMGFISLISFAVVVAATTVPEYLQGGVAAIDNMRLLTSVIQGFFVVGVEILTSKFSSELNTYLWSPKRFQEIRENQDSGKRINQRLLELFEAMTKLFYQSPLQSIPEVAGIAGRGAADGLRAFSKAANYLLIDSVKHKSINEGKPFLTAGFYYINMFNFMYATSIFAVGYATSYFTGIPWKTFGDMIFPTAASTLGFYFALAMNQNLIGRLQSYGQISEFMRLRIELMSLYLAKPGRIIATIPGFQTLGVLMQFLSGTVGTIPSIFKITGLERYARKTGEIYENNAKLAAEGKLVTKPVVFKGPAQAPKEGSLVSRVAKGCLWALRGGHLNLGARLTK
jgi:hypothetical protein